MEQEKKERRTALDLAIFCLDIASTTSLDYLAVFLKEGERVRQEYFPWLPQLWG